MRDKGSTDKKSLSNLKKEILGQRSESIPTQCEYSLNRYRTSEAGMLDFTKSKYYVEDVTVNNLKGNQSIRA